MSRRIINWRPSRAGIIGWGAFPFVLAVAAYCIFAALRHADNPNDKLLPGLTAFGSAIQRMAIDRDTRTDEVLLWADTLSSLRRLLLGLVSTTAIGLVIGIATGIIPYVRAGLSPFGPVSRLSWRCSR